MHLTDQIHTYLADAPASHFLGQPVTIVDHWEGRDNLLWRVECRGQEALLKLFLDAGQARGRRQFDAHELFSPYGLVPRPLWFDRYPEGLSRQVLVYAWAEGEAVSGVEKVADAIAAVHNSDLSAVRRMCPHPLNLEIFWSILQSGAVPLSAWLKQRQADPLNTLFAQIMQQSMQQVTASLGLWRGASPVPVHGELRLENVIEHFGTVQLLDWEFFGLGDPALEIANFLHLHRDEVPASWLDHYLAQVDQPGLAERIDVYQHLLPIQSLCFLLNGLHAMSEAPSDEATRQALPFLFDTVEAALQQTTATIGIQSAITRDEIEKLA